MLCGVPACQSKKWYVLLRARGSVMFSVGAGILCNTLSEGSLFISVLLHINIAIIVIIMIITIIVLILSLVLL